MADHVIVDCLNVVLKTSCHPRCFGQTSVIRLLTNRQVTVTEVIEAFLHKILTTEHKGFSITLVIDCKDLRGKSYRYECINKYVGVVSTRNADDLIVSLFEGIIGKPKFFNCGNGDNIFIITDDTKLRKRVSEVTKFLEDKNLNVCLVSVPSARAANPVVPMVIDLRQIKKDGLFYLHPFSYKISSYR